MLSPIINAQIISMVDQKTLYVKNTSSNVCKISLVNKNGNKERSTYIMPGKACTFPFKFTSSNLQRFSIVKEYDVTCYREDIKIITQKFKKWKCIKERNQMQEAILRGLDQYFLDGAVSNVIDRTKMALDLINGKDLDQWTLDFGIMLAEDKLIEDMDDRLTKSLAAAAFSLKGMLLESGQKKLNDQMDRCISKLKKKKHQREEFQLKNRFKKYPTYEFEIEATIPVFNLYSYLGSQNPNYGEYIKLSRPFMVRIVQSWRKFNGKGNSYIPIAFGQTPFMYLNDSSSAFPSQTGYTFNHIDLGVGYNLKIGRKLGINLSGEIGMRVNFLNTYNYVSDNSGTIESATPINSFKYSDLNLLLGVGFSIDLHIFSLIGRYHMMPILRDKNKNLLTKTSAHIIQVGVSIPIFRKNKFYPSLRTKKKS
jgi:hypothetical protein